jgi:4-deoxy-L-threo-5-hexosulose-uronate ketol-isomerase
MEVRYVPNQDAYERLNTAELRKSFMFENIFAEGAVRMVYCDTDRAVVGGAIPTTGPLKLEASKKEMAAEHFTERREIGIVNVGGSGTVHVDDKPWKLQPQDMLYVGRGKKWISFSGDDAANPPAFYFVSYPAHREYPDAIIRSSEAEVAQLGATDAANVRAIRKYIHTGGAKSCQLVMGLTDLAPGSIWNTMPAHTHQRRSEVYLYFGINPDSLVVHLMGRPEESRSLIIRNRQAVISPSWSIHCGAGTRNYSFVWAMGGENQEFSDMDPVAMTQLR